MKTVQEHKNVQCTMNNVQWRKVRFDGFFDMLPTNTLSRDKLNNQRGEYQNIHYGDVLIKYPYCLDCNNNEIPYINDGVKFNTAEVKDGDVIFADTAEDDTVGKCVEVLNVGDRKIVSGLHTYFCRPRHKLALGYLGYYLNSNHFHNQLLPYIAGSKVSSVNRTSIARTYISYPASLTAQRRIAAILASADKVIAATPKTIAKYKQMKQGMMEDLLKPKEGWKMVKLGEVCERITDGSHDSPKAIEDGYYMPSVKDMSYNCFDFSSCKQISENDYLRLKSLGCKPDIGDVLIAKDGSILKYCFVVDEDLPIVILSSIAILKPKREITDSHYLAYYFQKRDVVNEVVENYKSGTGVPRIVLRNFEKIEITYPDTLQEQRRIAAILSVIDGKIAAEEKVLEKYEKVKKGLMERMLEKNISETNKKE